MRKGLSVLVGLQILALGISQAQTSENTGLSGHQITVGASAIGVIAAGNGAWIGIERMQEIYLRHSVKAYQANTIDGSLLSTDEVHWISKQAKVGDEVRITYRSTEIEERQTRISQLDKRRKEILSEIGRLRDRMMRLRGSQQAAVMNSMSMQISDNAFSLSEVDHQLNDLKSGATRIDPRVATRVLDLSKHSPRELETYLIGKSVAGKNVIQVEVIPRASRMEVAKIQRALRGQMIVGLISGIILLEEISVGLLGDQVDTLKNSKVFVPVLAEPGHDSSAF